ncbi:hypothetical protein AB1Y20_019626 [Prymnesium parvum]|uniref:SAYSvFN domain-containing protein n=1 Tax=Prymnesium parvum TaxID=97485 RepID=A0AB34JUM2_PRYPA
MEVLVHWEGLSPLRLRLPDDPTVGALKQRLSQTTGAPRASIRVATPLGLLDDECLPRDVPLAAFSRRYSLPRSEAAAEAALARAQAARAAPPMRSVLRGVSWRTWAWIALWVIAGRGFKFAGFGAPFFIASLIGLILLNLGTRREGEASAYTVFNEGNALPGQLRQEDLERELLHQ